MEMAQGFMIIGLLLCIGSVLAAGRRTVSSAIQGAYLLLAIVSWHLAFGAGITLVVLYNVPH